MILPSAGTHEWSFNDRHSLWCDLIEIEMEIFQPWSSREVGMVMTDWVQWRSTIPGPTPPALSPHYQRRSPPTARTDWCSVEEDILTLVDPATLWTLTPPSGPRHTASVRGDNITPVGGERTGVFSSLEVTTVTLLPSWSVIVAESLHQDLLWNTGQSE